MTDVWQSVPSMFLEFSSLIYGLWPLDLTYREPDGLAFSSFHQEYGSPKLPLPRHQPFPKLHPNKQNYYPWTPTRNKELGCCFLLTISFQPFCISPLYRWENWGSETLVICPKHKMLIQYRTRIWSYGFDSLIYSRFTTLSLLSRNYVGSLDKNELLFRCSLMLNRSFTLNQPDDAVTLCHTLISRLSQTDTNRGHSLAEF